MSHDKKFNNESQDARRRDKHNEEHPYDKKVKNPKDQPKGSDSQPKQK